VSRPSQNRTLWAAIVGVPALFVSIAVLQARIDPLTHTPAQEKEDLILRSPSTVKKMSLGYDSLLADIYWTRAVQYYGSRIGTENPNFDQLWPLLDITTTLDPKLVVAYRVGAIFLSERGRAGAGRADLAVELLRRGIAANPDQWRLYGDLGFIYYWWLQDYTNSAAAYLEGSKVPNSLPLLKMMAARVAEKGGSLETSAMIWSDLYSSTKNPSVRAQALEMLRGLKAQQDEIYLDEIAEKYKKRFGRYPASTRDIRDAGLLGGIPVDPLGFPYVFGPDGKSRLNPQSTVVIPTPPKGPPERSK
jgi:hypothetical protein